MQITQLAVLRPCVNSPAATDKTSYGNHFILAPTEQS